MKALFLSFFLILETQASILNPSYLANLDDIGKKECDEKLNKINSYNAISQTKTREANASEIELIGIINRLEAELGNKKEKAIEKQKLIAAIKSRNAYLQWGTAVNVYAFKDAFRLSDVEMNAVLTIAGAIMVARGEAEFVNSKLPTLNSEYASLCGELNRLLSLSNSALINEASKKGIGTCTAKQGKKKDCSVIVLVKGEGYPIGDGCAVSIEDAAEVLRSAISSGECDNKK